MTYQVYVKPSAYTFSVDEGETVIAAAVRQGYRLNCQCQNTSGTACKGQLLDGKVTYASPPKLSLADRETGQALFCQAIPQSDLTIYLEGISRQEESLEQVISCRVVSYKPLAETVWQVILQSEDSLPSYRAGQYLEILHQDGSPKPFSIANAPNQQGLIELHIRHFKANSYTSELMQEIQSGQPLRVRLAFGSCVFPKDTPGPTIFLAGGTGFAPFKAILEQAIAQGLRYDTYLYWGARSLSDLYLHELALAWQQTAANFHYIPVLSAPHAKDNWQGKRGFVHEAVVADTADLTQFTVYASGPTEMVFAALRLFQAHGLSKGHMYSDVFDYETPL